jgi:hypothetical protein
VENEGRDQEQLVRMRQQPADFSFHTEESPRLNETRESSSANPFVVASLETKTLISWHFTIDNTWNRSWFPLDGNCHFTVKVIAFLCLTAVHAGFTNIPSLAEMSDEYNP